MSQTLYEEAIAEARRLTEMAEQNAKNKIIDAVTPQIKKLIEQELMGADDEDLDDEDSDELDPEDLDDSAESDVSSDSSDDEIIDLDAMLAGASSEELPVVSSAMDVDALPPTPPAPINSPTSLKMTDGEIEIKVGDVKIAVGPDDGDVELDETVSHSLADILSPTNSTRRQLRNRLSVLEKKVSVLKGALLEARTSGTVDQKQRVAKIFESLVREAVILKKQAILTGKNTGGRTLESRIIKSIIKEMRDMSRRTDKNVFDFLFEAEEVESEEKEAAAETDAADVDVSAAGDALKSLGDALGLEVTVGSEEEAEAAEGEKGEDAEIELDLGEADEAAPGEEPIGEMAYEIDEVALRRELRRLRSVNEGDAVDAAESFGGGEADDKEPVLNKHADDLGDAPHPKMGSVAEARRLARAQRARASVAEAALRRQVADYRNVAAQLKSQLVEMNLFNAKLLYANKLMQNRDLTAKQQRAIVEALDNAKTLREAKLLYKSLTSSHNKAANKGSLAEGRDLRTLGSASKSARSAQPTGLINESGSNDRWALLAGIKKD